MIVDYYEEYTENEPCVWITKPHAPVFPEYLFRSHIKWFRDYLIIYNNKTPKDLVLKAFLIVTKRSLINLRRKYYDNNKF